MTGAGLAERLVARGLEPAAREQKRDLFDRVLTAYAAIASAPPPHVWWVPGRLEVFGKHTDYGGGRSLVCAVPRGLALVARPRADGQIRLIDTRRKDEVTLNPAVDATFTGWRNYAQVVARRLARNFPGAALGADIVFASDLPRASGMSSSSALVVGVAAALVRIAGIEARAEWRANVRNPVDVAGYYACLENGRTFGTLEGDAGVGTHGGSEDHAAIITARPGCLSAFAFVPMREIGDAASPDEWRFVIAASGVASEKTGGAQDAYNRLAEAAAVLLDVWNRSHDAAPSLAAALAAVPDAPVRLRTLVGTSHVRGWTNDVLLRRLEHFIREDARVPEALAAFRQADAVRLAELSAASQADAEILLDNQVPATMALAREARARGAFAACSFGAGFGGSVWALVERDNAAAFAERWHPDAFVFIPGPSLTALEQ